MSYLYKCYQVLNADQVYNALRSDAAITLVVPLLDLVSSHAPDGADIQYVSILNMKAA